MMKDDDNVLALENMLVALIKESGDGPCFEHLEFSCIDVIQVANIFHHFKFSHI